MLIHCLIVYDIADPRRLQKIAKILEDFGQRMQKSVFEARLNPARLQSLAVRLCAVAEAEDGIKIFRLCEACCGRRTGLGRMEALQPEKAWAIL